MKAVVFLLAAVVSLQAADPEVGVVRHGDSFELSVIYSETVGRTLNLENYQLSPGELTGARATATNRGVILTATGLQTNTAGTLVVTGVVNSANEELPIASLPFNTGKYFWLGIGGNEVPTSLAPEVTAIGTNGFDLVSTGIQQFDDYEEVTFAGEFQAGDFDQVVNVTWVDPAGLGAKAGLMAREKVFEDEGKSRPTSPEDPAQFFSRYLELAVSATTTATGDPGFLGHQILQRARTGDPFTSDLTVTNDAVPAFPDAWLRLQRIGDEFKMYRGTNGLAWEQIGSARFPTPATNGLYVGVAFTPQNDNLPQPLRQPYVAKFRTFGGTNGPSLRLNLNIARVGDNAVVSWTGGILQTATNLPAQWLDAPSQANPQTVGTVGPGARFYRLRGQN